MTRKTKAARIRVCRKIEIGTIAAWIVFAMFCFGVTPALFHYSYAMRGYNAIGGEYLIPLLPFIFMPQFLNIRDVLCHLATVCLKKDDKSHYYARKE